MASTDIHTFGFAWPDEKHGPWRTRFHFTEIDGRVECVGVDIRSFDEKVVVNEDGVAGEQRRPGPGGLTPLSASVVRSLPVKSLEREARRRAGSVLRWVSDLHDTPKRRGRELASLADSLEASPRQWHSREHFEQVAEIYRRAWESGDPAPTKAVEEQLKAGSRSAAGKWVARARQMGLLGETEQGRPGGARVPKRTRKGR